MTRFRTPLSAVYPMLTLILMLMLVGPASGADVPRTLSYQGTLTDNIGQPVTGPHQIQVRLYSSTSSGSPFWTETQQVDLRDGKVAITLGAGSGNPLDPNDFDGETYISLQVDGDAEMPRQPFSSVAYAFKAADTVPQGVIVMWSGSTNSIPSGWALCNGSNGTPNLRDRFIVGAGSSYAVRATGGSNSADIRHSHSISAESPLTNTSGGHHHNVALDTGSSSGANVGVDEDRNNPWVTQDHAHHVSGPTSEVANHRHTVNSHSHGGSTGTGGSASVENRPPYYALAFIMKL